MQSPQFYAFLPIVIASRTLMGLVAGAGVPAMLQAVHQLGRLSGPLTRFPPGVELASGEVGGVRGMWLIPKGAPESPVIVYLHGGAFVTGLARPFQMVAAHIGLASGLRVFAPDYGILPDHVYPAAHEDCFSVYRELADQGRSLAVVGDSSGGVLALATLLRVRGSGLPQPTVCLLLSPTVDYAPVDGRSVRAHDAFVHPRFFELGHAEYVSGNDLSLPDLAPVRQDLRGLAPIHVLVGEREFLRADVDRLERAARPQGVAIQVETWPRMWHGWYVMADRLPEGRRALVRAGQVIRTAVRAI